MRPNLTDSEYRRFHDWLVEEYGLKFGPEKRDILRSRLEPMRAELGLDTFEQLFFQLKFHPERTGARQKLLPHLTNNESYFFREEAQLDALVGEVLPSLLPALEARKRHEVRILSAGCAAGEEPYSIAIAIRRRNALPSRFRLRITGIDLDPDALSRARAGCFRDHALRRTDEELRSRYFELQPNGLWKLDEEVRELVRFQQVNLAEAGWVARFPRQDVIFCRNVLIYFDETAMRRAVDSFYEALDPLGRLFLGHAETLSRIPTRFVAVRRPGVVYYQRPVSENG